MQSLVTIALIIVILLGVVAMAPLPERYPTRLLAAAVIILALTQINV